MQKCTEIKDFILDIPKNIHWYISVLQKTKDKPPKPLRYLSWTFY